MTRKSRSREGQLSIVCWLVCWKSKTFHGAWEHNVKVSIWHTWNQDKAEERRLWYWVCEAGWQPLFEKHGEVERLRNSAGHGLPTSQRAGLPGQEDLWTETLHLPTKQLAYTHEHSSMRCSSGWRPEYLIGSHDRQSRASSWALLFPSSRWPSSVSYFFSLLLLQVQYNIVFSFISDKLYSFRVRVHLLLTLYSK